MPGQAGKPPVVNLPFREDKMRVELTLDQIERYAEQGLLLIPDLMHEEVGVIKENIERSATDATSGRMLEKDGRTLAGLRGTHLTNEFFARLVRHPKILIPAQRLLDSDVYVYQFKINMKRAFKGELLAPRGRHARSPGFDRRHIH
jgi:hypothetical protein